MKKIFFGFVIFVCLFLTGCGVNELENNAFPLAIGVEAAEDGTFQVFMAYPDLQDSNALENALSSDVNWQDNVPNLFVGADKMSENSSKNVDFNHLKVLVLDKSVLESKESREQVIAFFQEKRDAAWNTYVLLTDRDLDNIFSEDLAIQSSLGIYLEDLIEEWTNVRSDAHTTVGDLMSQYYNRNETALIPIVSVEEQKPVIRSFEAVKNLDCMAEFTQGEAYEIMLLQDQLKSFSFSLEDGTRTTLHLIHTDRNINRTESGNPLINITVRGTAKIENRLALSEDEQVEICEQAERELESGLLELAEGLRSRQKFEPTNSFLLLAGHNRNLWLQYGEDQEAYEDVLKYHIEVRLTKSDS